MATKETKRSDGAKDIHARISPIILRHLRRYDFAHLHLPIGRVLDAACGSGYGSAIIGVNRNYVGLDLSESAISFANKNYGPNEYVLSDITNMPFDDGVFDSAVSFETLEHIPEPVLALREFKRVLRPQGILIASAPLLHPDVIHHFRKYCFSEVISMFADAGLHLKSLFLQDNNKFTPIDLAKGLRDDSRGTLILFDVND